MSTYRLEMTRVVSAPADRVFAAMTTPSLIAAWVCPGDATAGRIECDARVGGAYSIEMKLPQGGSVTVSGRYLEIVANRRLVYTWKWAHESEESQVTVVLTAVPAGTEIFLIHENMGTEASRDGHRLGWEGCMDKLSKALA